MDPKIIQKSRRYFTDTEKHQVIREFLSSGLTKREIWQKHTGGADERGHLLRWMRELGYDVDTRKRMPNIVHNLTPMPKKQKVEKSTGDQADSFEALQLKKRIAELEKQLKDAELKAIAFSTMVDIAEKEFNIPIRKKLNTKP
jgi:transposase-like protein